ncbi:MAG TPA: DeoR/GlpR family DNA-binding transcription regulator [Solirubrobacteraceae bacterium]|nr:DeoR/GlpR family DNA-binding transcription regulator [Solirubrobacteraceae bacterium]
MLTDERRHRILEHLQVQGRVLASDLVAEFGVSPDTVRRDLRDLDEAGMLRRVHGGALPRRGDTDPLPLRARRAPEAKASIARRAAQIVRDGEVVMLDGGTTTLEVARALPERLTATVVTNSLPIALALADHRSVEVVVVGGSLRARAGVTVGAAAVAALAAVRADVLFLGVCGLHPEIGVSVEDAEEREGKRAMIAGAAAVVGLADHDKLGTALPFVVAPLTELTTLVTDATDDEVLAPYRALGVEVLQA